MMSGIETAIDGWRDFYAAVAGAAAALLGLVFVGLSLHLSLRKASAPVRSLAIGSGITLLFPMLVALMMLIPAGAPHVHGFGAVLLGLILVVELAWVARLRIADRGDTVPWLAYRLGIPLAACLVLLAGGIGMLVGWEAAVAGPAAFVFAMFVVGVQDAFDLVLGERGIRSSIRRARGDHPPEKHGTPAQFQHLHHAPTIGHDAADDPRTARRPRPRWRPTAGVSRAGYSEDPLC